MKERPILFSTPMVQAIQAGRKTMTRRIVKFPKDFTGEAVYDNNPHGLKYTSNMGGETIQRLMCPKGEVGDRLWVKEEHYRYGYWIKNGLTKSGRQKWSFHPITSEILYSDNKPEVFLKSRDKEHPLHPAWYKRLARFMPRSASRITLEITGIKVEGLQEISEEDAEREGVINANSFRGIGVDDGMANRYAFRELWESINGTGSWNANPWVWVIEFKSIKKEEQ